PAMLPMQVIRLFPKHLQNRNQNVSRLWINHVSNLSKLQWVSQVNYCPYFHLSTLGRRVYTLRLIGGSPSFLVAATDRCKPGGSQSSWAVFLQSSLFRVARGLLESSLR